VFEHFTEAARRAIFFSRYEASRVGEQVISSEHIVLGILREPDPVTTELWRLFDLQPEHIRAQFPVVQEQISSSAELPINDDVNTILANAVEDAKAGGDSGEVEPYHLVLAILRLPNSRGAELLIAGGIEYDLIAQGARLIARELKKRAEIEERTPITLRHSHYELLDRIVESMKLPEARRANRQAIALAIMDGLANSGFAEQEFASLEDFSRRLQVALARGLPGG
jgi:ATP-dependent Clp protease ATP-binding subunit ClpC